MPLLNLAREGWVQHKKKSVALLSQYTLLLRKETGGAAPGHRAWRTYEHRALLLVMYR